MIQTFNVIIGDKVCYRNKCLIQPFENGIIKEIVNSENVRVVYNCNNDWDNYKDYTAVLTSVNNLDLGWS